MFTSTERITDEVTAAGVSFSSDMLSISLSDGRIISIPLDKVEWLHWLKDATTGQRNNWHIEPGGFAIYWDDLDDGVEVQHLLGMQPLT